MKRRLTIVATALVAMACIGCGDKAGAEGQNLVGTWEQTIELTPGDDIANQIKQAMADSTQMTIDIRDDSTFTLTVAGNGSTGTWEYADDRLTLTYGETTGMVLGDGKSVVMNVEDGGDTLRTEPSSRGTTTMFTRQQTKPLSL